MATPPPTDSSTVMDNSTSPAAAPALKPIHSLVLDTGPLIKNDPSVSALLSKAEELYTIPSVIPEIRDAATRTRVETTLLPFVTVRAPQPKSVKFVTDFARRTGDLAVLSKPDIEVIALGYELECERNNGDWRLRNTPGQKRVNGRPEPKENAEEQKDAEEAPTATENAEPQQADAITTADGDGEASKPASEPAIEDQVQELKLDDAVETENVGETKIEELKTSDEAAQSAEVEEAEESDDDDDDDGWITPSNLKKQQAKDAGTVVPSQPLQKTLQAAILTSDYAMQNVALRINLNLITPAFSRITYLKNWVLRCHGCFTITKDMEKQFCPKCGHQTLMRASCSTDQHGNFQVHLKKNFQWNNRGNVYSVPKAVHGSSNGRLPHKDMGGKNGWGRDLILAEDQKEYIKANEEQRRTRKQDIMDEDYLPGILSGKRSGGGSKIRVGAGRNVNSKSKH